MAVITKKFNVEILILLDDIVVTRTLFSADTSCFSTPMAASEFLTVEQAVAGNSDTFSLIDNVRRIGSPDLSADLPVNTKAELSHISEDVIKTEIVTGELEIEMEFDYATGLFDFKRSSFDDVPFPAFLFAAQEVEEFILHVRSVFGI